MEFQLIIAMNVTDPARYAQYRAAMSPVLARFGGRFEYDLVVSEVLRSPAPHPITRFFTIVFPNRQASESFFADPSYLAAKAAHFAAGVNGFTVVAEHDRPSGRAS